MSDGSGHYTQEEYDAKYKATLDLLTKHIVIKQRIVRYQKDMEDDKKRARRVDLCLARNFRTGSS